MAFPTPTTSALETTPAPARPVKPAAPPSLGRLLLLAAALFSLALPVVGPLDDHHFAERTHTHEHIYLAGRPVPHLHVYEAGRPHWHAGGLDRPAYGDVAFDQESVAFLTPTTASLMLAVLNAPYHPAPDALRPPAPRTDDDNPLARFAAPAREPDSASVPPPQPPPVA